MKKKVIICGGGAAGFFAAITIAEKHPEYEVTILEKTNKILSKVRISGGGRCNVTNARSKPSALVKFYPRGEKKLYKTFQQFSTDDMVRWLQERNVKTKTENDLRIFPLTDSSETIIECFLQQVKKHNIRLLLNQGITALERSGDNWSITTQKQRTFYADAVIIATGSSAAVWKILEDLNLKITPPVPSLFTFNIKDPRLKDMQGISFKKAIARVAATKLKEEGPLLITHWGFSGPAVLKVSAWGARILAEKKYKFNLLVNFTPEFSFESCKKELAALIRQFPKRKVINYPQFNIPRRYWENLCHIIGINEQLLFADLGNKLINKLSEELTQANFEVSGKSTFKEEFVTCGGLKLSEINLDTFESKKYPGLYFTGEVLNIDGITGGFNFQSCWSSAWVISEKMVLR